VHNVVLGGDAAGQPVNLLELLMEGTGGGDRTAVMDLPPKTQLPERANVDLTAPVVKWGTDPASETAAAQNLGSSDFSAVIKAFQPAGAAVPRLPTQPSNPVVDGREHGRARDFERLVDGFLDTPRAARAGDGEPTQVMGVVGADRRPAVDEPIGATPQGTAVTRVEEATLADTGSRQMLEAKAARRSGEMELWVPWLLVAIVVELLAILVTMLVGWKH
jgi:hypothetical protein